MFRLACNPSRGRSGPRRSFQPTKQSFPSEVRALDAIKSKSDLPLLQFHDKICNSRHTDPSANGELLRDGPFADRPFCALSSKSEPKEEGNNEASSPNSVSGSDSGRPGNTSIAAFQS